MSAASQDAKVRLEAFVVEQQAALNALEASTVIERTRLRRQIQTAQAVLSSWDTRVDGFIDALADAGIHVGQVGGTVR